MTSPPCPLCGSEQSSLVETMDAREIDRAYRKSYGIETRFSTDTLHYLRCGRCQLRFFDPPSDGDADLYVQLQRHDWYYIADKSEFAVAGRYLPATGKVLEVGAGKAAFATIVGKDRYVGLEFNDAAIARAKADGIVLHKEMVQAHAAAHRGGYGAVVSFQVLEHVADPKGFVEACVEALAPGGHLILAVPDHEGLCGLAQNNILDMPPHHVSHWNEQVLRYLGEHHGLAVVAIEREPVAAHHQPWAARSVLEQRMRQGLGLTPSLLDVSLIGRVVGRLAAKASALLAPDTTRVSGHTIVACYRKPGGSAGQPVQAA